MTSLERTNQQSENTTILCFLDDHQSHANHLSSTCPWPLFIYTMLKMDDHPWKQLPVLFAGTFCYITCNHFYLIFVAIFKCWHGDFRTCLIILDLMMAFFIPHKSKQATFPSELLGSCWAEEKMALSQLSVKVQKAFFPLCCLHFFHLTVPVYF